jgi:uncharacterized protein YtpQ (UPF0354 family)
VARLAALLACAALAAAAAGCGGSEPSEPELVPSAFKEVVLAALQQAGLEPQPGWDQNVSAFEGPNRVDLAIDDDFHEYEADPERKDEIVAGIVEEAQQRLDAGVSEVPFEEAKDDVLPLLKAKFDVRAYGFEPASTKAPGGLTVVYVRDTGDSLTVLTPEDVERWGTSLAELDELALANLEKRTNEDNPLLCEPSGAWELCGWSTSDGYDAARMIVPGLRRQIVKELDGAPAVYAVPMDNVFVALPRLAIDEGRSEALLRKKVERDFQTSDNPVSPELFVEKDGKLVVLG